MNRLNSDEKGLPKKADKKPSKAKVAKKESAGSVLARVKLDPAVAV